MRHSYRPDLPPKPPPYRTQVFDPLGLVAGMWEALGITEGIDKATQQDPARRMVPAGHAGTALGLNGLGVVKQPRDLVPHFFPPTPLARLLAPGMHASPRNDDPLGRALETLYASGGTERSSLIAAPAAQRLGLAPTCTPLDSPSCHGDGRDKREPEPKAAGLPSPRGSRREHRPDLHHVMLEVLVEPQAGLPLLLQPRSGHSRAAHACGQGLKEHRAQGQTTSGLPSRVAARAFDSADHLQQGAETTLQGIPRLPATLRAAHQALAQADPQRLAPLTAGSRSHVVPAREGGSAPRALRVSSEHRHDQAPRTVAKPLRPPGQREGAACQTLRRLPVAGEAEAQHALATLTPG